MFTSDDDGLSPLCTHFAYNGSPVRRNIFRSTCSNAVIPISCVGRTCRPYISLDIYTQSLACVEGYRGVNSRRVRARKSLTSSGVVKISFSALSSRRLDRLPMRGMHQSCGSGSRIFRNESKHRGRRNMPKRMKEESHYGVHALSHSRTPRNTHCSRQAEWTCPWRVEVLCPRGAATCFTAEQSQLAYEQCKKCSCDSSSVQLRAHAHVHACRMWGFDPGCQPWRATTP